MSALVTFRLGISPLSTKSPPPPLPPMLLAILAVETTPRLILLSPLSTPERELGSGKRIWEGRVDFSFSPLTPPPPPAAPAGGSSGRSGNAAATTAALITGAGAAAAATPTTATPSFYFFLLLSKHITGLRFWSLEGDPIMLAAVKNRDAKKLSELMRQDPGFNVNMAVDENGSTLLHFACWGSDRRPPRDSVTPGTS